jgi:PEP-CTERM motif
MIGSASIITQTVDIPTQPTDVSNASAIFNLFGSSGAPAGSVLDSVTLELAINETLTSLTLTNNGTNTTLNTHYIDSANFDANDTADATDAFNLDAALSNSGNQGDPLGIIANISAGRIAGSGGTFICSASAPCDLPLTLLVDTGAITGTTSSYLGSGTFELQFSTSSSYQITGFGGNNVTPTQTNFASAVATVIYDYSAAVSTPEPGTTAMLAGGLLALVAFGCKRRAFGKQKI